MVGDVSKLLVHLLHFMPSLLPDVDSENVSHCSLEYLANYGNRFIMGEGRSNILQHNMCAVHN